MSFRTLDIIKNIFVAVAEREEATEEQRQILAAMDDFEPHAAFQHIDTDHKGYVTARDLCEFMSKQGHKTSQTDFELIVKYFQSMESDRLTNEDFSQILMPCSNDYLRSNAMGRTLKTHHVSKNVLDQLSTLLMKECEFHKDVESLKAELGKSPDFAPPEIFKQLDTSNKGYLDMSSVNKFLKECGYTASKQSLNSIIRRFDVTADAKITYKEFLDAITPTQVGSFPEPRFSNNRGYNSSYDKPLRNHGAQPERKYASHEDDKYSTYLKYTKKNIDDVRERPSPSRMDAYREFKPAEELFQNDTFGERRPYDAYPSIPQDRPRSTPYFNEPDSREMKGYGYQEQTCNDPRCQGCSPQRQASKPYNEPDRFDKRTPERYGAPRTTAPFRQAPIEPFGSQMNSKYESPSKGLRFDDKYGHRPEGRFEQPQMDRFEQPDARFRQPIDERFGQPQDSKYRQQPIDKYGQPQVDRNTSKR